MYFHAVMKMVTVKYQDNEVPFINELEYIDGEVWANVWQVSCLLPPDWQSLIMKYLILVVTI
jgi:glutamine cyclotransferase